MNQRRPSIAVLAGVLVVLATLSAPVIAHEYEVVDGAIMTSLTGVAGDADKGREIAIQRKKGNCLACHQMPIPEQQFHGEVGPDLEGVADRYSEGELRARVVNPKVANSDTIMPAFHKTDNFRVLEKFRGKAILSAQEVEDVVAYLMTLK